MKTVKKKNVGGGGGRLIFFPNSLAWMVSSSTVTLFWRSGRMKEDLLIAPLSLETCSQHRPN